MKLHITIAVVVLGCIVCSSAHDALCRVGETSEKVFGNGLCHSKGRLNQTKCEEHCKTKYGKDLVQTKCEEAQHPDCKPQCACNVACANAVCNGDPHCTSFDGIHFDYQGAKKYYLLKPCRKYLTLPNFELRQSNRQWQTSFATVIDILELVVPEWEKIVEIKARNAGNPAAFSLTVNSRPREIPFRWPAPDDDTCNSDFISVDYKDPAKTQLILSTSFGLWVVLSSHPNPNPNLVYTDLSVSIPRHPELKVKACGLLGRPNGDPKDDFIDANGKQLEPEPGYGVKNVAFGDSWIVPGAGAWSAKCFRDDQIKKQEEHENAIDPVQKKRAEELCKTNLENPKVVDCAKKLGRKPPTFEDCVFDLMFLENEADRQHIVKNIVNKFSTSCEVEIEFVEITIPKEPEVPEPKFDIENIEPGEVGESTIEITVVEEKWVPIFVITILEILVKKDVIDVPTANRILITLRIPGKGPFKPDGAKPFTPETITTIEFNVDPKIKKRIIELITTLIAKPTPTKIVHFFLTVILDNGIVNIKTIHTIITTFRITAKITFKVIEVEPPVEEPKFGPAQIIPGEIGESTIVIGAVEEKLVPAFVNTILDILVVKTVIDEPTANRILVTLRIPGKGRFKPDGAKPFTVETVTTIEIRVDPKTKRRFIELLTVLIPNPVPTKIIHFFLTILLDSGTINLKTADVIMTVFRITGKIRFEVIEPVEEPPLVKGKDPGKNMVLDSTVTITKTLRELPPLIKRLAELNVEAKLLPAADKADLLTTFDIQPGGNPIKSVDNIPVGGKAAAKTKFLKNLKALVANPKAADIQKALIKLLLELLLDNAAVDINSSGKFAAAYGIGTSTKIVNRSA